MRARSTRARDPLAAIALLRKTPDLFGDVTITDDDDFGVFAPNGPLDETRPSL